MAALRVPVGAVLLTAQDIDAALYAVEAAQRSRQRNGLSPLRSLARLHIALTASGHPDTPPAEPAQTETMTTVEAAQLLKCSERTARRLAPKLGGRNIGGRWLLDRQAVFEHLQGATAQNGNTL